MNEIFILKTDIFNDPDVYEKCLSEVSPARRGKVLSYRFPKDRFLSLGAGLLTDRGLQMLGLSEKTAKLRYSENEKPYLAEREDVFFNLSHSGEYVVCAFSDSEVGVDIEQLAEVDKVLIESVCVTSEKAYLISLPYSERQSEFFRLWTAKESLMKLLGTGLSLHPKKLELTFGGQLQILNHDVCFKEYEIDGYKLTACKHDNVFPEALTEVRL